MADREETSVMHLEEAVGAMGPLCRVLMMPDGVDWHVSCEEAREGLWAEKTETGR